MFLSLLIIYFVSGGVLTQEDCTQSFLCDVNVCKTPCGPSNCDVPDGKECDGIRLPLYDNPKDICSCCASGNRCVEYLEENDVCDLNTFSLYPRAMCGPQLVCTAPQQVGGRGSCQKMTTECLKRVKKIEEQGQGMNQAPPVCDDEGFFDPVQCNPGGLCRCVDKYTGDPIALGFGFSPGTVEAQAEGMDCLCAQQYHESLKTGCKMVVHLSDYNDMDEYMAALAACEQTANTMSAMLVTPEDEKSLYFSKGQMRCLQNGNFDSIQCVDRDFLDALCYCLVTDLSGLSRNSSMTIVDGTEELPCFDETIHYPGYYRPCEAKVMEMRKTKADYLSQNKLYISREIAPVCTPDGFYAKLQTNPLNFDQLYCSDQDGNQIDSFAGNRSSLVGRKMNCECAFTRKYLSTGAVKPECCANGNFEGRQCISGLCFCVDKYGRQIGLEVDQMDAESLQCEDFCCEDDFYEENDFCYEMS